MTLGGVISAAFWYHNALKLPKTWFFSDFRPMPVYGHVGTSKISENLKIKVAMGLE